MAETKNIANYRSFHNVLIKKMTMVEAKTIANKDNVLSAKIAVSIEDMLTGDIEELNDRASEMLTSSQAGLTDITYSVVGRIPKTNDVILKVTGTLYEEE